MRAEKVISMLPQFCRLCKMCDQSLSEIKISMTSVNFPHIVITQHQKFAILSFVCVQYKMCKKGFKTVNFHNISLTSRVLKFHHYQ